MPGVKTAISLEEKLFDQVNKLATDMHVSRSKLFTLAVKDYLKKQESKKLLAQLNAAYSDSPSEEEKAISKAMHKKQRKIVEQESW
ncbi:MAG: ribbon-helix-helix protein, CopG family [Desulfobulbaceae bacterium]|nr:ribbon-helix-helix protein, CopG family [Desulfobulbaceae bacterium]